MTRSCECCQHYNSTGALLPGYGGCERYDAPVPEDFFCQSFGCAERQNKTPDVAENELTENDMKVISETIENMLRDDCGGSSE